MKIVLLFILYLSINSCSSKVSTKLTKSYPALDYTQEVTVIGIAEETPADATEVGTIKIGDSGFSTNCGWNVVIEKAKTEARKAGGNVLKITSHIPPSVLGSSCDRITAKILKVQNTQILSELKANRNAVVDSTWDYAKIYVYRPRAGTGAFIGYDLYLGDSLICRMKNNSKQEIRVTKKGLNTLWAKTESKVEVPIDIEPGKEYYLKCGIVMGVMVGRPQLQLVDRVQGKKDYISTKGK